MELEKSFTSNMGLGIALAVGLFSSSFYMGSMVVKLKNSDKTIEVKGFSEQKITSDIAVWSGNLVARGTNTTEAFAKLETDKQQVLDFLNGEDIKPDQINTNPVIKDTIFKMDEKGNPTNHPESYILRQKFTVTSGDVQKIQD